MDIKDEGSPASPSRGTTHGRSHSGTKRRAAAGSRGVAHLTPDQLAKKRANDREAQRAIRERTKGQIETLERRIQELTSQQPYQDLQHVVRQKELVEAENEDIKQRLRSVLNIIQPLVDGNVLNGTLNRVLLSQMPNLLSVNTADRLLKQDLHNPSTATRLQFTATVLAEKCRPFKPFKVLVATIILMFRQCEVQPRLHLHFQPRLRGRGRPSQALPQWHFHLQVAYFRLRMPLTGNVKS